MGHSPYGGLIAINKSDVNIKLAQEAKMHYKNALHMLQNGRHDWIVPVEKVDSITGLNMPIIYTEIEKFVVGQQANGQFDANRKRQAGVWLSEHIENGFLRMVKQNPELQRKIEQARQEVIDNKVSPRTAANKFIREIVKFS